MSSLVEENCFTTRFQTDLILFLDLRVIIVISESIVIIVARYLFLIVLINYVDLNLINLELFINGSDLRFMKQDPSDFPIAKVVPNQILKDLHFIVDSGIIETDFKIDIMSLYEISAG